MLLMQLWLRLLLLLRRLRAATVGGRSQLGSGRVQRGLVVDGGQEGRLPELLARLQEGEAVLPARPRLGCILQLLHAYLTISGCQDVGIGSNGIRDQLKLPCTA